jgi:hypothetical protein
MKTHTFLWLLAITLVLLLAPLMVPAQKYREIMDTELESAIRWYGRDEVLEIGRGGNTLYKHTMVETGVDGLLRKHFMPGGSRDVAEAAPGVPMPEVLRGPLADTLGYWDSMIEHVALLCFRLAHAWFWIAFLHPFLIAIIFDGLMRRKAKIASFEYTSPTLYNLSWHAIIGIVALSFLFFCLASPITTMFYPAVVAVIGVLTRVVIANIQHSA